MRSHLYVPPHGHALRIAAVLVVLLTLAACGNPPKETTHMPNHDTTSFDEAVHRARAAARTALGAFPPDARLEEFPDGATTTYCSDSSDPPAGTPVNWSTTYAVRNVGADTAYFAAFEKVFREEGWTKRYGDASGGDMAMGKDGYTTLLTINAAKTSVSVETPCVQPQDPDNPLGS